ncbi:HNH endonuclease, partial [Gordonia amicalis]|nr:HNH endonuclease [Gordonia amicalis]MCZ4654344.1 HNH endonuclease [Gordonia amicalis]MDJ0455536.1 HNH endonuclease [Gordonia amicalis]
MSDISRPEAAAVSPSEAAALIDQLHSLIDELQTVDLTQCSDAELVDVAAETERAIARLSFAG